MSQQEKRVGLRVLPPEIRDKIFKYAACQSNVMAKSQLLDGFRGDRKLYAEALKAFYAINTFIITKLHYDKVQSRLSDSTLMLMKDLELVIR
jgi:hypothetical protein